MGHGRPQKHSTGEIVVLICMAVWLMREASFRDSFPQLAANATDIHRPTQATRPFAPITFVIVPKPQKLERDVERSMLSLRMALSFPFTKIVMLSNESVYDPQALVMPTIRALFGDDRIAFAGDLPTGFDGRPLIREWFKTGLRLVHEGFVCFVNGDITFTSAWLKGAYRVFKTMDAVSNSTVILGARTNLVDGPWLKRVLRNDTNLVWNFENELKHHVHGNYIYGIDLVMMHAGYSALNWDELPDFVIGLCYWDTFVTGWSSKRVDTVTMDYNPPLIHVNHPGSMCTLQNRRYFKKMAEQSPYFGGHPDHRVAKWKLDFNRSVITSKATPTVRYRLVNLTMEEELMCLPFGDPRRATV